MSNKNEAINRLKKVLLQDKVYSYEGFLKILKGDIYSLMSCYMTVKEDVDVDFEIDDEGDCTFCIKVKANNLKSPKTLL
ncbi:MAG: cell division topological specificity factor MinE [Christensenellales bacterium]